MTKNWNAVLTVLLVAGACHAGGTSVKDKDAPTTFATAVGCTLPPVPAPACPQPCCSSCPKDHSCLLRVKDWLCFVPLRTCPCECKHCGSCTPPLYVYFLRPCVEGAACYHYPDNCSACLHKNCGSCTGNSGCGHLFHTGCSTCDSCK